MRRRSFGTRRWRRTPSPGGRWTIGEQALAEHAAGLTVPLLPGTGFGGSPNPSSSRVHQPAVVSSSSLTSSMGKSRTASSLSSPRASSAFSLRRACIRPRRRYYGRQERHWRLHRSGLPCRSKRPRRSDEWGHAGDRGLRHGERHVPVQVFGHGVELRGERHFPGDFLPCVGRHPSHDAHERALCHAVAVIG